MNSKDKKVLLINPPHTAIGSRIPREQLPPLGLLSIGGPLIDAGFQVELLDAEFGPMPLSEIIDKARQLHPHIVMMGHSGSTSAHLTIMQIASLLKAALPDVTIVYGGVFPTYHREDVLAEYEQVDYIVRGEGAFPKKESVDSHQNGLALEQIIAIHSPFRMAALASRVMPCFSIKR